MDVSCFAPAQHPRQDIWRYGCPDASLPLSMTRSTQIGVVQLLKRANVIYGEVRRLWCYEAK